MRGFAAFAAGFVLLCAPAAAQETPAEKPPVDETLKIIEQTRALLDGYREVDPKLLGTLSFAAYVDGKKAGRIAVTYAAGEHEGRPVYAVTSKSEVTLGGDTMRDTQEIRIAPNLSLVSNKAVREVITGETVRRRVSEVTVGETVVLRNPDTGETQERETPERYLAGIEAVLLLGRKMDPKVKAKYLFNSVNIYTGSAMEQTCQLPAEKGLRPCSGGTRVEAFLVSFLNPQSGATLLWVDGKGGIVGFEARSDVLRMCFLAGDPDKLPAEIVLGPDPAEVTLRCFRGIYSADRKLLGEVFDFRELFRRRLGVEDPKAADLEKFREAVLAKILRKDEKALAELDRIREAMVTEVTEADATVRFDGRVIAQLHRKGGKWLIYWVKP
jgi:hypothetical protein